MQPKISKFKIDLKGVENSFKGIEEHFGSDQEPDIDINYFREEHERMLSELDEFTRFCLIEMSGLKDKWDWMNVFVLIEVFYTHKIGKRNFNFLDHFKKLERHCEEESPDKHFVMVVRKAIERFNSLRLSKDSVFYKVMKSIHGGLPKSYLNDFKLVEYGLLEYLVLVKILDDASIYESISQGFREFTETQVKAFERALPNFDDDETPKSSSDVYQKAYIKETKELMHGLLKKMFGDRVNVEAVGSHYFKFFGVLIPPVKKLTIKSVAKFLLLSKLWESSFLKSQDLTSRQRSYVFYGLLQPFADLCSEQEWEAMTGDQAFIIENEKIRISPDFGDFMRNEVKKLINVKD